MKRGTKLRGHRSAPACHPTWGYVSAAGVPPNVGVDLATEYSINQCYDDKEASGAEIDRGSQCDLKWGFYCATTREYGMRKCIDSSKKSLIEMVISLVVDVLHRQLKG